MKVLEFINILRVLEAEHGNRTVIDHYDRVIERIVFDGECFVVFNNGQFFDPDLDDD